METDVVAPVHVVTRARARELEEENKGKSDETTPSESTKKPKESWKARRTRRAASKKKQDNTIEQGNETAVSKDTPEQKERVDNLGESKERQPAGSVLAEKNYEPLDALLQAYEARLKPLETLEERWKHYPDPAVETRQLEMFKRLTEAAQALEQQLKITTCPRNTETHPLLGKTDTGVQPQVPEEETKGSHDGKVA